LRRIGVEPERAAAGFAVDRDFALSIDLQLR
jgi:hypothetical protein